MKLTKAERWILSNQYRILEALYPGEAKELAEDRDAIERGYEIHYDWMTQHIYEGDDTMSTAESKEVVDILAMFSALKSSFASLSDKTGIRASQVEFHGFDGNNETKQMGYARYFVRHDGGRFGDLRKGEHDDFNSHMPSLDRYRDMLATWQRVADKAHMMSKEQIVAVLKADR